MPARALGGNLDYLTNEIPKYRELGARFYISEFSPVWAGYGLGYYVTSHLLWDVSAEVEDIVEDFIVQCFGPAAGPMREFYASLNGNESVVLRHRPVAQLYHKLLQAVDLAGQDEAILGRIYTLLAYVRYVELISRLETANVDQQQQLLEEVYHWILRTESMEIVPTGVLSRASGFARRFPILAIPDEKQIAAMKKQAEQQPVSHDELLNLAEEALAQQRVSQKLKFFVEGEQRTTPWLRDNSPAFVFPAKRGETLELDLELRWFGASLKPRYRVYDPSGGIVTQGYVESGKNPLKVQASQAGDYRIELDFNHNLVRCSSRNTFYLDFPEDEYRWNLLEYVGSLSVEILAGREAQLVIGGQGKGELINVSIASADGVELMQQKNVDGVEPLILEIPVEDRDRIYRIRFDKPDNGAWEDMFIQAFMK